VIHQLIIKRSKRKTACVVGILYAVPFAFLHIVDYIKVKLDVPGFCSDFLQTNLFRKFLNYDENMRSQVAPAAMAMVLIHECPEVVEAGFMKLIAVVRILGKVFILCIFVYKENSSALLPMMFFPLLMSIWIMARTKHLIEVKEEVTTKQEEVVHNVHETCDCYRLIADFSQRPWATDRFAERVHGLTRVKIPLYLTCLNSTYFPKWLSTIFIGCFIILAAPRVLEERMSLGTYLALITTFNELGAELKELYTEVLELIHCLGPLQKVTKYMNGETDLKQKRAVHAATRKACRVQRERIATGRKSLHTFDEIPILLQDVRFRHAEGTWLIQAEQLAIPQGSLVALVGPHGGGKTTMLKLVAQIYIPQQGQIIIPTHLRVLHLGQDPIIFEEGLWENLTFGHSNEEDPARVRRILSRLELKNAVKILDNELAGKKTDQGQFWWKKLSNTEIAMIHIARALIANPELLVTQRPYIHFNKDAGEMLMGVLAENVMCRGLELSGPVDMRRPRTCIYTSDFAENAQKYADQVLEVKDGLIEEIPGHKCSRRKVPVRPNGS